MTEKEMKDIKISHWDLIETEFRDFYGRESPKIIWSEDRTEIDDIIYPPNWTDKDIREYLEREGKETLHYMEIASKLFSPFKNKFKWKTTEEDKE